MTAITKVLETSPFEVIVFKLSPRRRAVVPPRLLPSHPRGLVDFFRNPIQLPVPTPSVPSPSMPSTTTLHMGLV